MPFKKAQGGREVYQDCWHIALFSVLDRERQGLRWVVIILNWEITKSMEVRKGERVWHAQRKAMWESRMFELELSSEVQQKINSSE